MTHRDTVSRRRRRWLVLVPLILLGLAGCSSSHDTGVDASSAGPSLPTTTTPAPTLSPSPSNGNGTKAVCARVVKIVQDSSRAAINALTPALQAGDQKKVAEAKTKAKSYYRAAADELRREASTTDDPALAKEITAAAGYFDKAATTTTSTGTDDSLAKLSRTCAG